MTEDEVSALVSSALRRARKATTTSKHNAPMTSTSPEKLGIMPIFSFSSQVSSDGGGNPPRPSPAASPVPSPQTLKVSTVSPTRSLNALIVGAASSDLEASLPGHEKLGMLPLSSFSTQNTSSVVSSPLKVPVRDAALIATPSKTISTPMLVNPKLAETTSPDANVTSTIGTPVGAVNSPENLGMMPVMSFSTQVQSILSSHSESWSVAEPMQRSPSQELDDILQDHLEGESDVKSMMTGGSSFEMASPRSDCVSPLSSPRNDFPPVVEETTSDMSRHDEEANEFVQPLKLGYAPSPNQAPVVVPSRFPFHDEAGDDVVGHQDQSESGSEYTEESVNDHVSRIGSEVVLDITDVAAAGDDDDSEYTEETVTDEEQASEYTEHTIEDDLAEQGMEVELVDAETEDRFGSRALTGSPVVSRSPQSQDSSKASEVMTPVPVFKQQHNTSRAHLDHVLPIIEQPVVEQTSPTNDVPAVVVTRSVSKDRATKEGLSEEREVVAAETQPLTPTKKELWWTSPLKDEELADEKESAAEPVSSRQPSPHSIDERINGEVARYTSQTVERFPSPQIVRCPTSESRKENTPHFRSDDRSVQYNESEYVEEREPPRVSDREQIEFRHPYPLPPPVPRPRSSVEISGENSLPSPDPFKHWTRPKPELEKLLSALKGSSMPRRSNACGAMKVLSMKKKNQMTLVRTRGFLDCLVFVISEDIPSDQDGELARDARGRAVTTLLNVSEPKDNRVMVFTHPGVAEALVKVIREDQGEARVHACGALGMLAKTPINRQLMTSVEDLVDVLAKVLVGAIDDERPSLSLEENDDGDDEESDDDTDGFGSSSFSSESVSVQASASGSLQGSASLSGSGSGSASLQEDRSVGISSSVSSSRLPVSKQKNKSIRRQKNEKYDEFLGQARVNACATLSHLSKHCSISDQLGANETLIDSVVKVSKEFENPIHTKCIEIICNISRFPSNTADMARNDALINVLLKCGKSKKLEDRIWALRTFQNIASDSTSKVILANTRVLTLLSICAMRKDYDEQVAAVAGLYNLSTEPGAVVPLTNTRNVVATLVHLAHNTVSTAEVRHMACDALATIGLWLQTLAGSGKVPFGVNKMLLPSHATTGWERWD